MAWIFQLALPAAGSRKAPVRPLMYKMSPSWFSSAAAGEYFWSNNCSTWDCIFPGMLASLVSLGMGGDTNDTLVGKYVGSRWRARLSSRRYSRLDVISGANNSEKWPGVSAVPRDRKSV